VSSTDGRLRLGPDTVQRLLPQRRPLLMVDCVESYRRTPRPTLTAARHISANEPVFEGHFPALAIWPGCYTIEGLAQTCNLLAAIVALEQAAAARGDDPEQVLAALRNLERGHRLRPEFKPELLAPLAGAVDAGANIGFLAAADVRFVEPVFAGQRLDYLVSEGKPGDGIVQYEVEARVAMQVVARGSLLLTRGGRLGALLHR
jgi:3-hydroxyacyl-[acyl-carrier-protein] dehydratase